MEDGRQFRLDSGLALQLARAGCRKSFDELNGLGWDLQLQAQKPNKGLHDRSLNALPDGRPQMFRGQ
jgi:hypothetical protein